MTAVKVLKPADLQEKRQDIPQDFYALLDKNKEAFTADTHPADEDAFSRHRGGANDAHIMKRLKAKDFVGYQGFTDEDESFIEQVKQAFADGAIPKPTAKKVKEALEREIEPLKVLGILRRDIPVQFLQPTIAQSTQNACGPREVILSSYLLEPPAL